MRAKERIPIVLKSIDIERFLKSFSYTGENNRPIKIFNDLEIQNCTIDYYTKLKEIECFWEANPDLRLTQVLVSMGLLQNEPGGWYYCEEVDWLIENKIVEASKILFWGTYGKDGEQPLKHIAIKDMDTNHIEACLQTQNNMRPKYRETMEKELALRKNYV